ncbi:MULTISPECIES: hypothetical protein [Mammaliicoccus]|uniref:hypothetical protein n=1 Tax=Mammaliicoccus TaxID=2803850 RepID=UPI001EFAFB75|nr:MULTISPECIES: hypothetical protein [Mammaliicoccus]MEB8091794.1 hypothetical protein [Mammaliicoccus lentus]WQK50732.1 hypothetical protein P3U54_03235 [Mammaliicoccus lentus]
MFKFLKKRKNVSTETHVTSIPKHIEGMTLVDAYYIQDDQVAEYIKNRERYRDALIYVLGLYFSTVEVMFEGSVDGEAVVAFENNIPIKCIYLDPMTIDDIRNLELTKPLKEALLEYCKLNE